MSVHKRINLMNTKIALLNHGYVQHVDTLGTEETIVRSARVSYDGKGKSSDRNLIRYLMSNGHFSVFEHNALTLQVKAPIFILRQWMRHQSQKFNELSMRYAEPEDDFFVPALGTIGVQSEDNKQMRDFVANPNEQEIIKLMELHSRDCYELYQSLLHNHNVPRELSRTVLPVSIYSRIYVTGSLRSWVHFLDQRLDIKHAQFEIVEYARAIFQIICEQWPLVGECMVERRPELAKEL